MITRILLYFWRRRINQLIGQIDLSDADKQAISSFLRSVSGQRLILCLQKISIQMNAQAVSKGTPFACGQATGYQLVFHDLIQLSAVTPNSGKTEDTANQGDAEFLERYSP